MSTTPFSESDWRSLAALATALRSMNTSDKEILAEFAKLLPPIVEDRNEIRALGLEDGFMPIPAIVTAGKPKPAPFRANVRPVGLDDGFMPIRPLVTR